jgi:hypothetical protein
MLFRYCIVLLGWQVRDLFAELDLFKCLSDQVSSLLFIEELQAISNELN